MKTQVRKVGNSLGSIIPSAIIKQMGLIEGSVIDVKVEGSRIVIEPIEDKKTRFPFSEKELLKGLDSFAVHSDEVGEVSDKEMGE